MSTPFQKIKIPNRDNKPLRTKGIAEYPQAKSKDLPKLHFTCAVIGAKGSGKSFAVAKLLKLYEEEGLYLNGEKVEQRIIMISPSADTNPQFNLLKYLDEDDIYPNYTEQILQNIIDDVKNENELAKDFMEREKIYKKFLKTRSLKHLTPRELLTLDSNNFEPPEPEGRYKRPPAVFLICDDLMGASCYTNSPKNKLMNLCIKHRHVGISIFFILQALKQLPKPIRANCSIYCLYRYNSNDIIKDMFEEVSGTLTEELFQKIYDSATEERYCCLVLDQTKKDLVIKQNWDTIIKLNDVKKEEKKSKDK
jgi:hypothetical protein